MALLPVTVVAKLVVAGHSYEASGAGAERVEDLRGGVTPDPRIRQLLKPTEMETVETGGSVAPSYAGK